MDEAYFFKAINEEEKVVGGVVYKSNYTDAQNEYAEPEEVEKAMRDFMLSSQTIKIEHKGKSRNCPVVESYFSEDRHRKGDGYLEKGDWYMSLYLGRELDIWNDIKSGKLRGFSMSGQANKG